MTRHALTLAPARDAYEARNPTCVETIRVTHPDSPGVPRRFRLGVVPEGQTAGRILPSGAVVPTPGPWGYVFELAAVLSEDGGSAADDRARGTVDAVDGDELTLGDYVFRLSARPRRFSRYDLDCDVEIVAAPTVPA